MLSIAKKPYEPLLEESDDSAYQRFSRNLNVCHSIPLFLVMHPQFYLFKDLKSFSFITEAFNVGNFFWSDVEQCAKMLVEKCPNLEVYI